MIKPIMRDIFFLNQKSEPATEADKQIAIDLLDTLKANETGCVGMAAKFNPKIVKRTGAYETEEGCLSLDGVRSCRRYQEIEVEYQDMNFKKKKEKYSGWTAQIIQHEIDHCDGILI